MANKSIRGIAIEIGGNLTPLNKALGEVNKSSYNLKSELRDVEKLLKLDPKNTELLAQKQKLLAEAVDTAREKLDALKRAQAQVEEQVKIGKISQEEYRAFQREVVAAEQALNSAEKASRETGKETGKLGDEVDKASKKTSIFGDVLKASLAADAIKAGLSAIISSVKALGTAVKDYISVGSQMADAETQSQMLLTQVMKNTMDASDDEVRSLIKLAEAQEKVGVVSKTAQVTALAELASFVEKKSALEDMLPVMNDYVAYQYGTTVSEDQARNVATALGKAIQGNIDGLAKQGFTLSKAEKDWFKTANEQERVAFVMDMVSESMNGVNQSLAQTDAGKMAILKTNIEEAQVAVGAMANDFKTQILGGMMPSLSSLSGAFINLLHGEGSVGDMSNAIGSVFKDSVKTIKTFLPQILDIGKNIITSVVSGITENVGVIVEGVTEIVDFFCDSAAELLPMLADAGIQILLALVNGLVSMLPTIVDAAIKLIMALVKGITDAIPTLIPVIIDAVVIICQALTDSLPVLIEAGIGLLLALVDGLLAAIPQLIAALPTIIDSLLNGILGAVPQLVDAGIQLLTSLVENMPAIISAIVQALPQIITNIIDALLNNIPLIIQAGIDLLIALVTDLPTIILEIVKAIPLIIAGIVSAIVDLLPKIIQSGKDLFVSLVKRLPEAIREIAGKVPEIITGIVDGIKNGFSKMKDAGLDLVKGLWQGISDAAGWIMEKIKGFMDNIVGGIKKFFGINSPSTLFRDMIGANLVKGIGVGVELETPNLQKDINDNMAAVTAGIQGTFDIEATKVTATGAAAAGAGVNLGGLNFHIEKVENASSRDIYNLMDDAMEAAEEYIRRKQRIFA